MVEGKYTDLVGMTDMKMANPAFTKFKDAQVEITNRQYISLPLYGHRKQLISTFQIESKVHIPENRKVSKYELLTNKVKQDEKLKHAGFAMIDRLVMNILSSAIRIKLD